MVWVVVFCFYPKLQWAILQKVHEVNFSNWPHVHREAWLCSCGELLNELSEYLAKQKKTSDYMELLKYIKDCKTWRWLLGTFPYWSWALTFLETKSPCLNKRNGLTLPCLSHCALNTNLCWQGVMSLLFTASAGQTSTERFGTNKGDTTSTQRYSSYLIKSDNMLVTVMLTINHTRNLWNQEVDGKTHDECDVLSVSWLVMPFCSFSACHLLVLPEMLPYCKIGAIKSSHQKVWRILLQDTRRQTAN